MKRTRILMMLTLLIVAVSNISGQTTSFQEFLSSFPKTKENLSAPFTDKHVYDTIPDKFVDAFIKPSRIGNSENPYTYIYGHSFSSGINNGVIVARVCPDTSVEYMLCVYGIDGSVIDSEIIAYACENTYVNIYITRKDQIPEERINNTIGVEMSYITSVAKKKKNLYHTSRIFRVYWISNKGLILPSDAIPLQKGIVELHHTPKTFASKKIYDLNGQKMRYTSLHKLSDFGLKIDIYEEERMKQILHKN